MGEASSIGSATDLFDEYDFGSPVEHYVRPLTDDEREVFDRELDEADRAHSAAAARLPFLFAGGGV